MTGEYVSPYGKPGGLVARLVDWTRRMGSELPWAGLGIIGDIKLAAQILNSREFLEGLAVGADAESATWARALLADAESATWARALLADLDTLEAAEDAAARVQALPGVVYALDPVAAIERLDADYLAVRNVLISCGALGADDTETPIADLVRALLS